MVARPDDVRPVGLAARTVRYADLIPCLNAFVDSRTPGSDAKENFTIIGPGVSENPAQHVHIPEAHGFNIGGARQPPGCLNSQHSHLTAEVFVVHSGEWVFRYGVDADDGEVRLCPGDTISIPTRMYRGFENVGDHTGFLFAVLGGDDPGRVTWAPRVFELADRYGLVLLAGGRLVDTALGQQVPEGAHREQPPTPAELAALATPDAERLAGCVAPGDTVSQATPSDWAAPGVQAHRVIDDDPDAGAAIRSWWPHGFSLHRLVLDPVSRTEARTVSVPTVVMVVGGELGVQVDDEKILLGAGDTFTAPRGGTLRLSDAGGGQACAFIVQGNR